MSGFPPYGSQHGPDGRLVANLIEQAILGEIAGLRAGGLSLRAIARELAGGVSIMAAQRTAVGRPPSGHLFRDRGIVEGSDGPRAIPDNREEAACRFFTAQDLAYAVQRHHEPDLTPRPWQFGPDRHQMVARAVDGVARLSAWQVSLSLAKDSPRKALLGQPNDILEVDKVFAGASVEKGYGPRATEIDPRLHRHRGRILDSSWLWPRLVSASRR